MGRSAAFAMLLAATAAMGQAPAAQGPQAAFNAGEAAAAKRQWVEAAAQYRAALAGMSSGAKSGPVVRARLAGVLMSAGDLAGARTEAERAIGRFRAQGVAAGEDLSASHAIVGEVLRHDLDMAPAIAAYRQAIASAAGASRDALVRDGRVGLALAAVTTDPAAAAEALDAIFADPAFATYPKPRQADLLSLRARAELNRDNAKAAATFVNRALDLVGRTSTRVTLTQVQIRGDAALIYAKLGDQESVRKFLTYSGAGHLPDNGWLNHADSDLPVCGGDVRPDDVAVVEFAIDDAGRTLGAAPIYVSRPGGVGVAFAQAVRGWRWLPLEVKKLDLLWRSSVRVELRCVTRPPGIKLAEAFAEESESWLTAHGAPADLSDPNLKADTRTPAGRVVAAFAGFNALTRRAQVEAADARLRTDLDAADAPAALRATIAYAVASHLTRVAGPPAGRARLESAIADLQGRVDSGRAAAWLRTELALRSETAGDLGVARAALTDVTALPAAVLPQDDPVRTVALLHLSLIDKRTGRAREADARLVAAGMNADSCSLLDVQPVARNMSISSSAFPAEALRWGFEGTVREAFDINADGSVAGVRTVIAYPPLVFGPATEKAVRDFRYQIPTIGDKPLGCTAQTVNVRYVRP